MGTHPPHHTRERRHSGVKFSNYTADEVQTIKDMEKARHTVAEIAAKLGRSVGSVKMKLHYMRKKKAMLSEFYYDEDADPFIIWICDEMAHRNMTVAFMCARAGIKSQAFWNWRHQPWYKPKAEQVNAMLKVLGYKLEIVPDGPPNPNTRIPLAKSVD